MDVLGSRVILRVPDLARSRAFYEGTLGLSIYRAQVFPKYAGALLVLLAFVQQLTGPLAFTRPIFAIIAVALWAWLGWSLYSSADIQKNEPQTAQQVAVVSSSR